MNEQKQYDVIIIGGGLAGLTLAIQLRNCEHNVLVLEKENYPKHKVCGEYIGMESKPFLEDLGLPVSEMNLPFIKQLQISDTKGSLLQTALPKGGFGISRYKLDAMLAELAIRKGVHILTKTRVDNARYTDDVFAVSAGNIEYTATVVVGAWGKRSNMDIKSKRSFINEQKKMLNNYIGVKYHIRYPWPKHVIALHNFPGGYCGISSVENDTCCLCYLTNTGNLQKSGNNIKQMEQSILMQNPHLHEIFSSAEFLYEEPLTISQISFEKKEPVYEHIIMPGDAAGLITPLCGNGMSMAFHSSKLSNKIINNFLVGKITRSQMENEYIAEWNKYFSMRLKVGRFIQSRFGKYSSTFFFLYLLRSLPFLQRPLIRTVAGKIF